MLAWRGVPCSLWGLHSVRPRYRPTPSFLFLLFLFLCGCMQISAVVEVRYGACAGYLFDHSTSLNHRVVRAPNAPFHLRVGRSARGGLGEWLGSARGDVLRSPFCALRGRVKGKSIIARWERALCDIVLQFFWREVFVV